MSLCVCVIERERGERERERSVSVCVCVRMCVRLITKSDTTGEKGDNELESALLCYLARSRSPISPFICQILGDYPSFKVDVFNILSKNFDS